MDTKEAMLAATVGFSDALRKGIDEIMGNKADPFAALAELAGVDQLGVVAFFYSQDDPDVGEQGRRISQRAGDMILGAYLAGWRPTTPDPEAE